MGISFNPENNIIRLCMLGMGMEETGDLEEARKQFRQAWDEAANDFEWFIAAYFISRHEKNSIERLKWLEISLQHGINLNDDSVNTAFPTLYANIATCYEEVGDSEKAKMNNELSNSYTVVPADKGPFYHGTKADLQVGDVLVAGHNSNYKSELKMNHIYFTSNLHGAGLAAGLAKGDGRERVYIVEPTGTFEHDPNVTDKKFPGNLTCSYRSKESLKIVGEETEWVKQTPEYLRQLRENIAKNKGEIIN